MDALNSFLDDTLSASIKTVSNNSHPAPSPKRNAPADASVRINSLILAKCEYVYSDLHFFKIKDKVVQIVQLLDLSIAVNISYPKSIKAIKAMYRNDCLILLLTSADSIFISILKAANDKLAHSKTLLISDSAEDCFVGLSSFDCFVLIHFYQHTTSRFYYSIFDISQSSSPNFPNSLKFDSLEMHLTGEHHCCISDDFIYVLDVCTAKRYAIKGNTVSNLTSLNQEGIVKYSLNPSSIACWYSPQGISIMSLSEIDARISNLKTPFELSRKFDFSGFNSSILIFADGFTRWVYNVDSGHYISYRSNSECMRIIDTFFFEKHVLALICDQEYSLALEALPINFDRDNVLGDSKALNQYFDVFKKHIEGFYTECKQAIFIL